jgi:hypothetical protein
MLKQRAKIILTTQMSKVFYRFRAQFTQVFNVTGLQLAPSMTIIFLIHTLELSGMSQ